MVGGRPWLAARGARLMVFVILLSPRPGRKTLANGAERALHQLRHRLFVPPLSCAPGQPAPKRHSPWANWSHLGRGQTDEQIIITLAWGKLNAAGKLSARAGPCVPSQLAGGGGGAGDCLRLLFELLVAAKQMALVGANGRRSVRPAHRSRPALIHPPGRMRDSDSNQRPE